PTRRSSDLQVRHARECLERGVDDGARAFALQLRDQAETATVVFSSGVVESPIRALPHRRVRDEGGDGRGPAADTAETMALARINHILCAATTQPFAAFSLQRKPSRARRFHKRRTPDPADAVNRRGSRLRCGHRGWWWAV